MVKGDTCRSPAARDFVASVATQRPQIIVSHGDCVLTLPEGSELVGSSASCEYEVFLTGRHLNILGVQSHPEVVHPLYHCCAEERIAEGGIGGTFVGGEGELMREVGCCDLLALENPLHTLSPKV